MKLSFTHRSTSRMKVSHPTGRLQLRDGELRALDGEDDPVLVATFDGETWVTPDGRVWTHIDMEAS